MAFLDIQFPTDISYGVGGGPNYSTDIVEIGSGYESRNINWTAGRGSWDASHGVKSEAQLKALITFFRVAKGRGNAFRWKDWMDYECILADGILATGVGDGTPTYKLYKAYVNAAGQENRRIQKPVSGSVQVYRNAALANVGTAAGEYSIDYTTGIVTFVADDTDSVSSVSVGATTDIVLPTNLGLTTGEKLYLSGLTGADAALLNGLAHTISARSGAGPYTFTLATSTAGATITVGSGLGSAFPQAGDDLQWLGEFDVPARFDTDSMKATLPDYNVHTWGQIPVVEIRIRED